MTDIIGSAAVDVIADSMEATQACARFRSEMQRVSAVMPHSVDVAMHMAMRKIVQGIPSAPSGGTPLAVIACCLFSGFNNVMADFIVNQVEGGLPVASPKAEGLKRALAAEFEARLDDVLKTKRRDAVRLSGEKALAEAIDNGLGLKPKGH